MYLDSTLLLEVQCEIIELVHTTVNILYSADYDYLDTEFNNAFLKYLALTVKFYYLS
jgi:hypothetical protein